MHIIIAYGSALLLPLRACGERVDVRGLGLAERPPHPPPPYPPPQAGQGRVGATSPRERGEVEARGYPKVEAKCDCPAPVGEAGEAAGRTGVLAALDADQARAAEAADGPLIIM